MSEWKPASTVPEDTVVMTLIADENGVRNEQQMRYRNRLWWFPDGSMYVYYKPTHWKPIND